MGIGEIDKRKGSKRKKEKRRRERKGDGVQDQRRSPARRDPDDSPTRRRTPISDDDDDEDANEDLTLGILEQARQCRKAAGGHPGDGHLPSLSSDEDVDEGAIPDLREEDRKGKDGKKDKKKKKKKSKRKKTNMIIEGMKGEGDAIPDLGEEDGIGVAAATGKHLMKNKQHLRELFVSKAESVVCESLDDFILKHLKGTDRTLEVAVPGSKEKKTYLVPALVCRLCTNELAELLVKIIQAGWSFSVDLDPTDFVVTPLGHLKIALQKMEFLEHANLNSIKKNAATAALIVCGCIFNNSPLPHDINCFVTVLEQFNGNCKAMIHHPGLKDEVAKLSQFEVLYMRSVQIFHLDKVKHKRIMDKLPYCHVNKNHWKLKMEANLHFERILKHTKRKSWQLREPVSVDQEQSEGQDEGSHRSKRRRLSTSEKRKLKKQGQEPLLPVGVTQQPRHLVSETAQAVKSEGYKVTPDIAKRVTRATLADDSLFPLMTHEIGAQVSKIVAGQPKYPPVFGEEAEADVKAFFQVLLDLISVEYADDGSALSRTVRNSQVHVVLDFSVQPARAGRTISEGKKKGKKKKARPPEPAALRFTYA